MWQWSMTQCSPPPLRSPGPSPEQQERGCDCRLNYKKNLPPPLHAVTNLDEIANKMNPYSFEMEQLSSLVLKDECSESAMPGYVSLIDCWRGGNQKGLSKQGEAYG